MTAHGHQITSEKPVIDVDETIVDFFDLLARFQFEDEQNPEQSSEEIETDSPVTVGESISGSCEEQPTSSEEPSFRGREAK